MASIIDTNSCNSVIEHSDVRTRNEWVASAFELGVTFATVLVEGLEIGVYKEGIHGVPYCLDESSR